MSEWREANLGELAARTPNALATGPFGSAISAKYFVDDGVPVIRGSNLSLDIGVRLCDEKLAFLAPEKAASFGRSIARRGDLIFTCWGTIGQVGLVDDRAAFDQYVVSNKQMKLTPDPSQVDSLFLYYLMSSPAMVAQVQQQSIGAAVPGFNLGQLRQLRVRVPDLATQRRIAAILGTLDDLIENNLRRIQILEEMAKAIYREWFVRLHVPGYEPAEISSSELGPMPEGWTWTCLSDHVRLRRDNVRPDHFAEEEFIYYSIPAFDETRLPVRELGAEIKSGKYLLPGECVLLSKLNPRFPRVWRANATDGPLRAVCSTEFLVLDCAADWPLPFVYSIISSPEFGSRLTEMAGGTSTSHQRTKPTDVMAMRVLDPPAGPVDAFTSVVGPLLREADNLILQNGTLTRMRNLMLPKLVTGQIDVSALDFDAMVESVA